MTIKFILTIFLLSFQSLVVAQIQSGDNLSPFIKEAIVSCLNTIPKTNDNKTSHTLVKKCLESKGIEPQKTIIPFSTRQKYNEALKQCYSQVSPDNKKQLHNCLMSKGVIKQ